MTVAADTVLPSSRLVDVRLIPDKRVLRAGLLMLLFMTAAFGAETWNTMQDLAIQLKAVPVILFAIVCVLVARLYAKVDQIVAVRHSAACTVEPVLSLPCTELAPVPLETRNEIWKYWDENGNGKQKVEHVRDTYVIPANVVQRLLEDYDVRWREQVALLCSDDPRNEYAAYIGADPSQMAEDAVRLKSGLPIYPVAGVWLCSDCRKRPCRCD